MKFLEYLNSKKTKEDNYTHQSIKYKCKYYIPDNEVNELYKYIEDKGSLKIINLLIIIIYIILSEFLCYFRIKGLKYKEPEYQKRIIDISKYQWFENPLDLVEPNKCDILIELIGEEKGLSYELIKKTITNKINVITANKAVLAKHGNELFQLADSNNVKILFCWYGLNPFHNKGASKPKNIFPK